MILARRRFKGPPRNAAVMLMIVARTAAAVAAAASANLSPTGAAAQMTVFDPNNYAQMLKQVSQSLQQIQALQNQLQLQGAMLATLQKNVTAPLAVQNQQTSALLAQAQGIGYQSANTAQAFAAAYPASTQGLSAQQISAALTDWQARSRTALQDAMTAQAIVAQTQSSTSNVVATGVAASQGAPGQTAAIQATNQLIAALSTQLSQLQTLMLTAARSAETAEAQHQSVTAAAASESVRALQFSAPPSRLEDPSKL